MAKNETYLTELPKVSDIEISIAALEKARDALELQIRELRAKAKPYRGEVEPLIDPRTGKIYRSRRRKHR